MEVKNKKLKKLGIEEPVLILVDGRTVIGMRTDENNKLFYVIDDNGTKTIEPAQGQKVAEIIPRDNTVEITVQNPKSKHKVALQ